MQFLKDSNRLINSCLIRTRMEWGIFYSTDIFVNVEYVFRTVLGFGITDFSKSLNLIYLFLRQRYISLRLKDFSSGE